MSEQQKQETPAAESAAAPPPAAGGPALPVLLGVAAAALIGGAAAGLFLVAPRMVAAKNGAPAHAAKASDPHEKPEKGKSEKGEKLKPGEKRSTYRMDNVIVNPAHSNGTRFLMATVAVELDDPKAEASMKERDFELRDAVVSTLENQSLDMLTRPGARDTIRHELEGAFEKILGQRPRVFLPQFVIQ